MKVYKKDNKIIFEIPCESPRYDPYSEKEYGLHPALVGLISLDEFGNRELGWANVIDMGYKDKHDQFTDYLIKWHGGEEEFLQICESIGVGMVDLSVLELKAFNKVA